MITPTNQMIQIQAVTGGFILQLYGSEDSTTEVFTSQGKLLKAVRTALDGVGSKEEPKEEAKTEEA